MSRLVLFIAALLTVSALAIGEITTRRVSASPQTAHSNTAVSAFDTARLMREREATIAQPRVDRYGNEISDAVGDYRVDGHGELYENHAPDTAVLKLASPGT